MDENIIDAEFVDEVPFASIVDPVTGEPVPEELTQVAPDTLGVEVDETVETGDKMA